MFFIHILMQFNSIHMKSFNYNQFMILIMHINIKKDQELDNFNKVYINLDFNSNDLFQQYLKNKYFNLIMKQLKFKHIYLNSKNIQLELMNSHQDNNINNLKEINRLNNLLVNKLEGKHLHSRNKNEYIQYIKINQLFMNIMKVLNINYITIYINHFQQQNIHIFSFQNNQNNLINSLYFNIYFHQMRDN